jgi:methylated-DNA-protein-cysteine methyltransferase-like protein
MDKDKFFQKVYKIVREIPQGRVATYGQLAGFLGTKDARKVGWALHGNKDLKTPCHRVVNKDGRVAPNYAFGSWKEQKLKLLSEGIKFVDETHVDLKKFLWKGQNEH